MIQTEKREITFEPLGHTYTDEHNNAYTSVTTLIGQHVPKFNKRYWSMYVALRDSGFRVRPTDEYKGIIVDGGYRDLEDLYLNPINSYEVGIVVDRWKDITQKANDRGNNIHDFLEDNINASKDYDSSVDAAISPGSFIGRNQLVIIQTKHDLDNTKIGDVYPEIYHVLLTYVQKGCTLIAEKLVYSSHYLVAGKIDVLVIKGKYFAILDWKTNKDAMIFESGYFKKRYVGGVYVKTDEFISKKEYLLPPINNVEKCKGMVYSLQLSMYAMLMIFWGYTLVPNGLGIFHIRPKRRPIYIPIKFMREEALALLDNHYNKKYNVLQCITNETRIKKPNKIKLGIR